jgi:hypothetical protein
MVAMKLTSMIALLSLALAGVVSAAEPAEKEKPHQPKPGSAELERMKALAGTWKGKTDMGGGETEITVQYRIVSGGAAVEERVFEGTPHEMVTMYYDKNGKLAMTHYCVLGNRPGLVLKSADAKNLEFDFDATCGVDDKTEMHMHSLAITFDGPDSMTQTWQLFDSGKPKEHHPFTLKRVKS